MGKASAAFSAYSILLHISSQPFAAVQNKTTMKVGFKLHMPNTSWIKQMALGFGDVLAGEQDVMLKSLKPGEGMHSVRIVECWWHCQSSCMVEVQAGAGRISYCVWHMSNCLVLLFMQAATCRSLHAWVVCCTWSLEATTLLLTMSCGCTQRWTV